MAPFFTLPNCITLLRIPLALWMSVSPPFSAGFFVAWLLGGVTDAVDGPLARKLVLAGKPGAMLDSLADLVYFGALLVVFVPLIPWRPFLIVWVAAISLLRLIALCAGLLRFHRVLLLHTISNKVTGAALFLFPLLSLTLGGAGAAIALCVVATFAAVEECVLLLFYHPGPDTKGVFFSRLEGK